MTKSSTRYKRLGSAWERLGALGRAWGRLEPLGNAWDRLGVAGSAWDRLGALLDRLGAHRRALGRARGSARE
eukprot:7153794-Pyramimonas_sp.AAC.1